MSKYANIQGPLPAGGIPYCQGEILPSLELDLAAAPITPIGMKYDSNISAIVEFTAQGVQSQSSYVILQTDWGDGNWVDVAWCNWSGLGTAVFELHGVNPAASGSFQQTRTSGTTPTPSNSSNAVCLGDRLRFVGKGTFTASSSSSSAGSGAQTGVFVTIRYRQQGLR